MKRLLSLALAGLLALGLTACGAPASGEDQESVQVFAMDTVMLLTAYGEESAAALHDAEEEIYRLEDLLSRTRKDSQVGFLNGVSETFPEFGPSQTVEVGEEVCSLIETAGDFTAATGGAFDITIAPVASAWGFTADTQRVPGRAELAELLEHVGMEHVHTDQAAGTAWLDGGAQIDLGGIAKGYAADRVGAVFRAHGVPRGLISLGGNVLALGDRPDGTPWRVGIQDPAQPGNANAYAGVLHLSDAFAVTSGGYQRYFEENGKTYHHIIDPATGYPADSGLTSVTVVAGDGAGNGTMCDALSTALFVMGEERALELWRGGAYEFELVLVTADGRVVITGGLADRFTAEEQSGYIYETVS